MSNLDGEGGVVTLTVGVPVRRREVGMTEAEWLACQDAREMLDCISSCGFRNDRKLRLFAVASCRQVWFWMEDEENERALTLQEQLADVESVRVKSRKSLP